MNLIELITTRRSVRQYKPECVARDTMIEIMEATRFAPSWANFQIARFSFVEDREKIEAMMQKGVKGFAYNVATLSKAPGVLVLSYVKGKSGSLGDKVEGLGDSAASSYNKWEEFDAGIACQTFCLAAHAKGVGTCIMGVIDEPNIARIVGLPDDETVAALIPYGYPEGELVPPPRKSVDQLVRFID